MSVTESDLKIYSEKLSARTGGIGDSWVATLTRGLAPKQFDYRESTEKSQNAGNGCSRTMPYYVVNEGHGKKVITVTTPVVFTRQSRWGEIPVGVGSTVYRSKDSGFTALLKAFSAETDADIMQFVVGIRPSIIRPLTHGIGHAASAAGSGFSAVSSALPSALNFGLTRGIGNALQRKGEQAKDAQTIPLRAHYINLVIYKSIDPTTGVHSLYLQFIDPTRNLIGVQRLTKLAGMLEEDPVLEQLKILISEPQNRTLFQQIFSLPVNGNIIVPDAIATKYQSILGDKRCGLFGSATITHLANVFTGTTTPITPNTVIEQVKQAHADFVSSRSAEQIANYIRTTAQARATGEVAMSAAPQSDPVTPAAEAADDPVLGMGREVSDDSLDGFAENLIMLAMDDDNFVAVATRATVRESAAVVPAASGVISPMTRLAPQAFGTVVDAGQAPAGSVTCDVVIPTAGAK